MNIKTIILVMLLSALTVGCSNSDEITEEERRIKEETTVDLMSKKWVNNTVRANEIDTVQETRTLEFGVTSVEYNYIYDSVVKRNLYSFAYEYIVDYTISKDGKKILVTIPGGPFTLDYSTAKLSGMWGKSHLEFLPADN